METERLVVSREGLERAAEQVRRAGAAIRGPAVPPPRMGGHFLTEVGPRVSDYLLAVHVARGALAETAERVADALAVIGLSVGELDGAAARAIAPGRTSRSRP